MLSAKYVSTLISHRTLLVSWLLSQAYGGCLCLPQDTTIGRGVTIVQLCSTEDTDSVSGQGVQRTSRLIRAPLVPAPEAQPHFCSHQVINEGHTTVTPISSLGKKSRYHKSKEVTQSSPACEKQNRIGNQAAASL